MHLFSSSVRRGYSEFSAHPLSETHKEKTHKEKTHKEKTHKEKTGL
jgi:hypothetical protein